MFDRSAAVKLQLRDKKGKWIKMGSHVKWHSLEENSDVTGIARGQSGNNIVVEFKHAGQTYHINVPHNKVEVINEKASLDPAYVEHMGGHTNTPNIADHGVTTYHTVTHYGVESKNANAPLTTKISDLKPGDVVYPIKNHDESTPSSIQKSPYNVKEPTTKANMQKFATSGHGVVKKIVHDKDTGQAKYAVITDKKGKDHFPSAQHYAIKQHDTLDQAILDAHANESQAMGKTTKSGLVDDVKGTHTTQDKFDASKAPVGSKVESTGINGTVIPLTKTGEDEWTHGDNGTKLSDDVVDHMMGAAPEKSQDDPKYVYIDNKTAPEPAHNTEAPIDISGWTKKPGSQMGSNAGGVYTDQNGKDWYVKLSQSDDHARSEVLADDLYKAAGVQTSNLKLADVGGGKLGTASQMMPNTKQDLSSHFNDPAYMAKIQDGFAMDALLANWDVAGLGYDNIITDEHGNPVRVDPGGALLFRAQGQPKGDQFGNKVGEWESLRGQGPHSNEQANTLFGKMTDQQLADSAKHVEALTPEKINSIVDTIGFDNKTSTELKDKLAARREDILAHAAKLSPTPAEPPVHAPAAESPAQGQVAPQAPANHPDFEINYPDKGKDQIDANGKTIKVNDLISHPKKGVGKVFIGLPSTNSVKVVYPDGSKATHLSKAVTKVESDVPKVEALPSDLKVGDHGIDPATHTAFIVGNNNSLIHVGDTVTHSNGDKGVVKGIYKGEKTVKVEWADGHTSGPKKASTLESENKHAPDESNAPQEAPAVNHEPAPAPEPINEPQTPEPAHEEPSAPASEESTHEAAPALEKPSLGDIANKNPADLTKEEVASLPIGTEVKKGPGSLYYQKKVGENEWQMHTTDYNMPVQQTNKSDENVLGVFKDSAGMYNSIHLPENASTQEPASIESKNPSDLSKGEFSNLPIGTELHKGSSSSFYQKKVGDNQWQMMKLGTGQPAFGHTNSDEEIHGVLQNSPGLYQSIKLPEPAAEAPAIPGTSEDVSTPSILHDPTSEDLAKLPDGTVLVDPNLQGFTFTKNGNDWTQKGPSGQEQDLSPHSIADGSSYHVQTPEAPSHVEDASGSVPSVLKDPSIDDLNALPEGTVLTDPKLEGFTYTKQGDTWLGVGPNGYGNPLPPSSMADGATYHVQAPEGTNTVDLSGADPTTSGSEFKPMSTQELTDFPVGTKITTNHVMSGGYSKPYWIKQSDGTFKEYDELTGHEETGHNYPAFLMSGGFALKAELPAENTPAADDLTGKPLLDVMHSDKFSSLPIGSEIHSVNDDSFVYKKVGNGIWNRITSSGFVGLTTYTDSDFTKLEDHALDPYVLGKVGNQPVAPSETVNTDQKLSDVISSGAFSDTPLGTELHYQSEGVDHFYKKTAPNAWQEISKTGGAPTGYTHADSVFTGLPKSVTDKYSVVTPSETVSIPDAGVTSLTGVSTGNTLSKELLDAQPAGTTMKKESTYGASAFYYIKQSDGTWKLFKNGQETNHAPYMSNDIKSTNTTATFGVPTAGSKFFYSKSGEIVYEGDKIDYKGASGTISSITNAGLIAVKLDGENKAKYKSASQLIKTATYGKKDAPAFQPAPTPGMDTTPSGDNHTGGSETAGFAGASGAAYDQQGAKMPSTTSDSHLSNGLTLAPAHEADTSNPLYGTPEPQPPVTPAAYPAFHAEDIALLPKWDSAKWLEAVKARYDANPNKAKATLEESAKWNTIQTVLNGEGLHLDSLVNSKYLDDNLKKEAIDGIAAQEAANKPMIDAHNAKVAEAKKQYDAAKAQHLDEYAAQKQEFTQKLDSWIAANPNQNAMKAIQLPETSKESFTGGTADWSKAHAGTFSAQTVFDSIKKDDQLGTKGLSIATDSDQVEGLDANVMKILDTSGKPVMQVKMKLTGPYGAAFEKTLKGQDGVSASSGVYSNHLVNDPTTGLLKDGGKPPGGWTHSGTRYSWTDPSTGASVIFQRSSDQGLNVSAENNTVRIHMPENATPEDYQKVLENMGINAKPSSEGDIRVLAENQLMSMMGISSQDVKIYDGSKNHSGTERLKQLEAIEQKYGVTVDDMVFSSEANGRVRFFLKDDKAQALADKYGVKSFVHQVSDSYGTDTWVNMLTGPNNGLLSTYHRWNEGIGGTGMSSMSDHQYGSSDYIYTTPKGDLPTGGYSVVINPKSMFRRTDWWANTSDNYGQKGTGTTKSPYNVLDQVVKADGYNGGIHEALPKDSVPVSDWMYVTMGSDTRTAVLKALKERGVLQINGIPIEDFILAAGAAPPAAATPTVG